MYIWNIRKKMQTYEMCLCNLFARSQQYNKIYIKKYFNNSLTEQVIAIPQGQLSSIS